MTDCSSECPPSSVYAESVLTIPYGGLSDVGLSLRGRTLSPLQRGYASPSSLPLIDHIEKGGTVFATLVNGAMSTAEIGRSLAKMIRAGHIAAISCTGANLEEDLNDLLLGCLR